MVVGPTYRRHNSSAIRGGVSSSDMGDQRPRFRRGSILTGRRPPVTCVNRLYCLSPRSREDRATEELSRFLIPIPCSAPSAPKSPWAARYDDGGKRNALPDAASLTQVVAMSSSRSLPLRYRSVKRLCPWTLSPRVIGN